MTRCCCGQSDCQNMEILQTYEDLLEENRTCQIRNDNLAQQVLESRRRLDILVQTVLEVLPHLDTTEQTGKLRDLMQKNGWLPNETEGELHHPRVP